MSFAYERRKMTDEMTGTSYGFIMTIIIMMIIIVIITNSEIFIYIFYHSFILFYSYFLNVRKSIIIHDEISYNDWPQTKNRTSAKKLFYFELPE